MFPRPGLACEWLSAVLRPTLLPDNLMLQKIRWFYNHSLHRKSDHILNGRNHPLLQYCVTFSFQHKAMLLGDFGNEFTGYDIIGKHQTNFISFYIEFQSTLCMVCQVSVYSLNYIFFSNQSNFLHS